MHPHCNTITITIPVMAFYDTVQNPRDFCNRTFDESAQSFEALLNLTEWKSAASTVRVLTIWPVRIGIDYQNSNGKFEEFERDGLDLVHTVPNSPEASNKDEGRQKDEEVADGVQKIVPLAPGLEGRHSAEQEGTHGRLFGVLEPKAFLSFLRLSFQPLLNLHGPIRTI
ncbi:hypothetical protein TsFJ059_000858 [Trichoderma semiorbis]|uniref:Uncharacterized protein n=1 Tax=Trichoderma semiorbis TaxID=1491008 RepID=A0A9P8HY75_9HYPO|nr:hypothetical protein TsFJ059_000858 [Trichoderma semiorbis]